MFTEDPSNSSFNVTDIVTSETVVIMIFNIPSLCAKNEDIHRLDSKYNDFIFDALI